jgi:hypothetical protein
MCGVLAAAQQQEALVSCNQAALTVHTILEYLHATEQHFTFGKK